MTCSKHTRSNHWHREGRCFGFNRTPKLGWLLIYVTSLWFVHQRAVADEVAGNAAATDPAQLAANWWPLRGGHQDRSILMRPLDWSRCIDAEGRPRPTRSPAAADGKVTLGLAVFGPQGPFLRDSGWRGFLQRHNQRGHGAAASAASKPALYLSALPYLADADGVRWLLPRDAAVGIPFFAPACATGRAASAAEQYVAARPHYYPSVVLRFAGSSSGSGSVAAASKRLLSDAGRSSQRLELVDPITLPLSALSGLRTLEQVYRRLLATPLRGGRLGGQGLSYLQSLSNEMDQRVEVRFYGLGAGRLPHESVLLSPARRASRPPPSAPESSVRSSREVAAAAAGRAPGRVTAQRVVAASKPVPAPAPAEPKPKPEPMLVMDLPSGWPHPQVSACPGSTIRGNRLSCGRDSSAGPVVLDWGAGWQPITVERRPGESASKPLQPEFFLRRMRPAWPFAADDPGWTFGPRDSEAAAASGSACSAMPRYRVVAVAYGNDRQRGMELPLNGSGGADDALPSLYGRDPDAPLPERATLVLEQAGSVLGFAERGEVAWRIGAGTGSGTGSGSGAAAGRYLLQDYRGELQSGGVAVSADPPPPGLAFGSDFEVHFHADREACMRGDSSDQFVYYWPDELERLKLPPCTVARVVERDSQRAVSACTAATLSDDEAGQRLHFDFQPRLCPGKRRLLVLSLSQDIDSAVRGREVRDRLREVLVGLQQRDDKVPFDLVTVTARNRVEPLLSCEQLGELSPQQVSTRARVRFGARDLDAPDDLFVAARETDSGEGPGRVLYITASEDLEPDSLSQGLGLTFRWQRDGVALRVLTHHKCELWRELAAVDDCVHWDRGNDLRVLNEQLDWLLQPEVEPAGDQSSGEE